MDSYYIPVILATGREGRKSEYVARFVYEQLKQVDGVETEIIDARDMPFANTLPAWEEHKETSGWKEKAKKADGFIIVTPEYNHGYPGELKLLLDCAYKQYFYKPVAVVGVSSGRIGGARAVEHLKPVLVELGMVPLKDHLYINAGTMLDNEGGIVDEEGKIHKQLGIMTERLLVFAEGLRGIRKQLLDSN